MRFWVVLFGAVILLSACVTTETLNPNVNGAPIDVKGVSYDKIWNVTLKAVSRRFPNVEPDKASGVIKARDGVTFTPWLEAVGVFIRPTEDSEHGYFINIVSQRRLWRNGGPDVWGQHILKEIRENLDAQ
ncbi:MAG: hypothetical protein JKY20_13180 [Alphaproteobacteria bacterium]|nr:hypothetical protein [Alphaproteobacteria bacterium]